MNVSGVVLLGAILTTLLVILSPITTVIHADAEFNLTKDQVLEIAYSLFGIKPETIKDVCKINVSLMRAEGDNTYTISFDITTPGVPYDNIFDESHYIGKNIPQMINAVLSNPKIQEIFTLMYGDIVKPEFKTCSGIVTIKINNNTIKLKSYNPHPTIYFQYDEGYKELNIKIVRVSESTLLPIKKHAFEELSLHLNAEYNFNEIPHDDPLYEELLNAGLEGKSLIDKELIPKTLDLIKLGKKMFERANYNWFELALNLCKGTYTKEPLEYKLKLSSNTPSARLSVPINYKFKAGSKTFTMNSSLQLFYVDVSTEWGYNFILFCSYSLVTPEYLNTLREYANSKVFDLKLIMDKILEKFSEEGVDTSKIQYASITGIEFGRYARILLSKGDPYDVNSKTWLTFYDLVRNEPIIVGELTFYGSVAPIELLSKGEIFNIKDLQRSSLNNIIEKIKLIGLFVGIIGTIVAVNVICMKTKKKRY